MIRGFRHFVSPNHILWRKWYFYFSVRSQISSYAECRMAFLYIAKQVVNKCMNHNQCLIKTATNRNLRLIKTLKPKSMFDQKCNMLMHRGHAFT